MSSSTGRALPEGIVLADTITKLGPDAAGAVVISGSHGGVYPGYLAAKAGVRGVILNDAGVGKDRAGIGSLAYCEALGIAAATVSHQSCRIGDTDDMLARGRVSHANAQARAAGASAQMGCLAAAEALRGAPLSEAPAPEHAETRSVLDIEGAVRRIVLIDSASLVKPEDAGQIVLTGSHGGLIGGDPAKALQVDGYAGIYNDAGVGADGAGVTRLPALDARGIAGLTVAVDSARIGDARSAYESGVISRANQRAQSLGAREGMTLRAVLDAWARDQQP
ncbi:MAG: hypothetical protein KDK91_21005 [Gammaproteobacteria bacterium]|nr:hypothetical protein [Gammaproteobacteria bacterium]